MGKKDENLRRKTKTIAVKKLVSQKPRPLQEKSTVQEAGETMRSLQAERFPVAAGDKLVGTIEGKYPERAAAAHGHDPQTTLVRDSMLKKTYYCVEDQSLEEVREMMRRHHLFHMPVVDKDLRIIGVVALCDVEDENVQKGGATS